MKQTTAPPWVVASSVTLLAWNLGLLGGFFLALGLTLGLAAFHDTPALRWASFILGFVIAFVLAGWLSWRLRHWFKRRTRRTALIILTLLGILTILMFPAPFGYVVH